MSFNLAVYVATEKFLLGGRDSVPGSSTLPGLDADDKYYEAFQKYHKAAVSCRIVLY